MKIINHKIAVGIWSEDHEALAKWYQDVIGLQFKERGDLPEDTYISFNFGDNCFWIGKHDKIHGKNKDPYRIMVEFYVESVSEAFTELKKHDVDFIAEPFPDPMGGTGWCMTFKDPEGNILQMYGEK